MSLRLIMEQNYYAFKLKKCLTNQYLKAVPIDNYSCNKSIAQLKIQANSTAG